MSENKETYESVVKQRDALAVENGRLCNRINHAEGCYRAAIFEGLNEAIIESYGSNLADIVSRRIVYAFPSIGEPNPATDAFTSEIMAKGVDALQIPESFKIIGENIRTQNNRATSHPLFAVMQKREIVVDGDYDHDRIAWWHSDGYEASEAKRRRLELLHDDFRDTGEWRRLAVKEINEFVTACFTEQGCKDYLNANGHNLRHPFIYVFSAHRNAEFIAVREWLAKGINDAQ